MSDASLPTSAAATPPPDAIVPPSTSTDDRPQYEFDPAQNEVINNLAMAILWVRVPLLIAAVFQGLIAIGLAFRIPRDGGTSLAHAATRWPRSFASSSPTGSSGPRRPSPASPTPPAATSRT